MTSPTAANGGNPVDSAPGPSNPRQLGAIVRPTKGDRAVQALIASLTATAVLIITLISLPSQPHLPEPLRNVAGVVQSLSPQGWAFFTRDPREPSVLPYVEDGDDWVRADRGPNAQPSSMFGIDRSTRLTEYDVSQVIGASNDENWFDCAPGTLEQCVQIAEQDAGWKSLEARGYDLRLCGRVVFVQEEPVPIAFAGLEYEPPQTVLLVDAQCSPMS